MSTQVHLAPKTQWCPLQSVTKVLVPKSNTKHPQWCSPGFQHCGGGRLSFIANPNPS